MLPITVQQVHNVSRGRIERLVIEDPLESQAELRVPLDDGWYTIELRADSVRVTDFRLLVEQADGSFAEVEPGPARTLRGTVQGMEGGLVAGSYLSNGLHALVWFPDGRRFGIEPVAGSVAGATAATYVIYDSADAMPSGGTCELLDFENRGNGVEPFDPTTGDGVVRLAEIALEADAEFLQRHGDVLSVGAEIEAILQATNLQYEREVGIRHVVTAIIVRTGDSYPYGTSNPEALLREVADEWELVHGGIARDVVQLFTGRDLDGEINGVAWRFGVCNERSYSVIAPGCCGNFGCKSDLSAHELGHNWGAGHCDCPRTTMSPTLTCANRFHSTLSVPDIVRYRDTRLCVSTGPRVLSLLIEGPAEVLEKTSVEYRAMAFFSDGRSEDVTLRTDWTVSPEGASRFAAGGVLEAGDVDGDTPLTVRATYRDETGVASHAIGISIVDLAEPDPRTILISLVPEGFDPAGLTPGQVVDVSVLLSCLEGEIPDVKFLQLDSSLSDGLSVLGASWDLESLVDAHAYVFLQGPPLLRATYEWESSLPGLIVRLTPTPQRVARLRVRFQETGTLDLLGPIESQYRNEPSMFIAGFARPREFSVFAGNVSGGRLALQRRAEELHLAFSLPEDGAIDARQPQEVDGTERQGWDTIELAFEGDLGTPSLADFVVTEDGGSAPPPMPATVEMLGASRVRLVLSEKLEVGAWTIVAHEPSGGSVRLAALPGDVNGDAMSDAADVIALRSALHGGASPIWSTDINRSGALGPVDLLRLVDLLNGAGPYATWNGKGVQ